MTTYSPLLSLFTLAPSLRRASNRVVSVYLRARSEGYDARFYDIEFGDLLHRYKDRLTDRDRVLMEHELRRLRSHLAIVRPAGCPAVAGFADEPVGLLEVIKLRAETDARLEVGELLVAPILRQLERFQPSVIAVVDKEEAKLLRWILDDVILLDHLVGAEVRHTRAGGTSAPSNQRKADNRTKANLTTVVKAVEREMRSGAYAQLFIAGPEEARTELERLLPAPLKRLVAGRLPVDMDSPTLIHDLRKKLEGAVPL
jgi:release factor family 10